MPGLRDALRAPVARVTAHCESDSLPFQSTDELAAIDAVFGQERAVRAIEFSLGMDAPGYHLYAAGPDGIGKSTIVESFLRRRAGQLSTPRDWVYVRNFEDPDRPVAISLPPGRGRPFAERVQETVEAAGREIRAAFESDEYARQRQGLSTELEEEREHLLEGLGEQARELGFWLQISPQGINSAPLSDGQPMTEEQFEALSQERKDQLQERSKDLQKLVQETMLTMRAAERAARERFSELDEDVAGQAIGELFNAVIDEFGPSDKIRRFLEAVRADIRKERDGFMHSGEQPQQLLPGLAIPSQGPPLRRYEVNALICHDADQGAPVIRERHPTYYNLLGRIEYQGQIGAVVTDHTMLKAGSLALANGGFIVLRMRDLLMQPLSFDALKRALATGELAIENVAEAFGLVPTHALRPEPIPLKLKVVIVGDAYLYSLLYRLDPDFRELFRVKADFDVDLDRNEQNIRGLAGFIASHCEREHLACFADDAVARLIEHSSRMVSDQRKLSANMGAFLDILRQANYWATNDGAPQVRAEHVDRALEERVYRSALVRDRIQEAIDEGQIYLEIEGRRTGQINALSVYDLGDIQFGRPSRITCVVSAGRGTIVMVDRETDMAGRIHNKGFLILRGFLTSRFGQVRASSLHASLTFEQQYGDIDGDSASSTELYALLSALAGVEIEQGIAVTGSVDQYGRIQPIGGVTAKIEGFFEICRARGLTGDQGVIVPTSNLPNVVLRPEVAQAVQEGRFHVWSVSTIEEGIELLTGMPAGERGADDQYPEDTIYRRVEDRLAAFARELREHPLQPGGDGQVPHVITTAPPVPVPGIPPEPPPEPPVIV